MKYDDYNQRINNLYPYRCYCYLNIKILAEYPCNEAQNTATLPTMESWKLCNFMSNYKYIWFTGW